MPTALPPPRPENQHRVIVAGGSSRTLDLLRLAAIGSDDVLLIAPAPDAAVLRFAERFAIAVEDRSAQDADLEEARAVVIAIGDAEAENRLVRAARRRRVPVHVADRDLVSDFRMLDFVKQLPLAA